MCGAAMLGFAFWEGNCVDPTPSDVELTVTELERLGFSREEATRLAHFRTRTGSGGEYAEQKAIEHRLRFMRWLVESGRIEH